MDRNLGRTLIDRATVGIGAEAVDVEFPEFGELRELAMEGKGLIVMTAHVGGWQVVMPALRHLDLPINLLLHRDEGDVDRVYFEHQPSTEAPLRIIDPAQGAGGGYAERNRRAQAWRDRQHHGRSVFQFFQYVGVSHRECPVP